MFNSKTITFTSNRRQVTLDTHIILYVSMIGKIAEIHTSSGRIYRTRTPLGQLEEALGEYFVKAHRGCLVSVMSIHDVADKIELNNGEHLDYTTRKKKQMIADIHRQQQNFLSDMACNGIPSSFDEYHRYYACMDHLPIAFADIEMIWGEKQHAVDWIFRYGNPALAKLEKIPLNRLINSSFSSLFANMNSKWLCGYERATLYGETLEIIDFSPEIDTYLKVICFPTFPGHCGCLLFDIDSLKVSRSSNGTEQALLLYLSKIMAQ